MDCNWFVICCCNENVIEFAYVTDLGFDLRCNTKIHHWKRPKFFSNGQKLAKCYSKLLPCKYAKDY